MQLYKQIMNRTMGLIGCEIWDLGERIELPKITNQILFFDPLFHYSSGKGVTIFYNFSDPKQNLIPLILYFNNNHNELERLKKTFDKNCNDIRKILKEKNIESLETLYDLLKEVWPLIAISNILGDDRDNVYGVDKDLVEKFIQIRKESDGVLHTGEEVLIELIKQRLSNAEYKDYAGFLLFEEIKNKLPEISELKKRATDFIFHKGKLFLEISLDNFAIQNDFKITTNKDEVDTSKIKDEIKGNTAFGGRVKGTVKVIFEKSDMKKVLEGDVLVTPMTTPDLIFAMKRASAFVTDEGGITCHASIVAREMAKPCIIGTKIATEILKDGDSVEVDADNGIVRIIK